MTSSYLLRGVLCAVFGLSVTSVSIWAQAPDKIRDDAATAVGAIEGQLLNSQDLWQRYVVLQNLPSAALAAGDVEKAEASAKELLKVGEEIDKSSRYKSPILNYTTHIGNTILGLIELKRGNIASAKGHLLASGTFIRPAHPVHRTFGPSMALAKALADRGEREVVIEYLELCAKFWENEDGRLEKWTRVLRNGGTPDFRGNVLYVVDGWQFRR
jgi:hypothetical protein